MDLREALGRELVGLKIQPEPEFLDRTVTHARLIQEWNRSASLVSHRDAGDSHLIRHFRESLTSIPWVRGRRRAVDLGSGGGFPGLVWKSLLLDLEIVLVDSSTRKAAFLREAVRVLGLTHVEVRNERVDDPARLLEHAGDLLSTRATSGSGLLLEAARQSDIPTRVILFAGSTEAARYKEHSPPGFRLTDTTQVGDCGVKIMILDRIAPAVG